jgi:hypothetical protein
MKYWITIDYKVDSLNHLLHHVDVALMPPLLPDYCEGLKALMQHLVLKYLISEIEYVDQCGYITCRADLSPPLDDPLGLIDLSLIMLNLRLLAKISALVHLKLDTYGPGRHRSHDQIVEDGVPIYVTQEDLFPETLIAEETLAHSLHMNYGLLMFVLYIF